MRLILLLLILLTTFLSNAQTLSLADLQNLCKKQSWESVDNYLNKKGWKYHNSEKGSSTQYSTITYSYGKNPWDDRAQAWFYVYAYNNEVHKIIYSYSSSNVYNSIKNSLAANAYKKTNSQILDQKLSTTYENSIYKIEVVSQREINDYYDSYFDRYSYYVIRKNGVFDFENGPVTNYWFDGSIMEEYTLKNGKYNGPYKFYSTNGKLQLSLNYVNDKRQGKGVSYFEDGGRKEMNYLNDKLNGKYVEYNALGNRVFETTMKDDSINGKFTWYFDDGITINITGTKIMGIMDGAFISYYDKDHKNEEGNFANGLKTGKWIKYPKPDATQESESLLFEQTFVDDKLEGVVTAYDKNGNLAMTINFSNGKKNGECVVYNYDENELYLKELSNFLDDEKHGRFSTLVISKDTTIEVEFGNYSFGKKNGLFKEDHDDYILLANYKNDLLHGSVKKYMNEPFMIDLIEKPIAMKNIDDLWLKSEYNYFSGLKNGYFVEYQNYLNYMYFRQTGFYENDKKTSVWKTYQQAFTFDKSEPEELIFSQTYSNDVLNGKTVSYFRHKSKRQNDSTDALEKCEISVEFKNGKFDGNYMSKNQDGKLEYKGIFSNGRPTKYWIYSLTKNPMEYEFYFDKIIFKLTNEDGESILGTYTYNKNNWNEFDYKTFGQSVDFSAENIWVNPILMDLTEVQFLQSFLKEKKLGAYEVRDKSGNLRITGFWNDTTKYGIWQYYYREQNVRKQKDESLPNKPTEYYTIDTKQPYTGEFEEEVEYQDSRYNAVYKIKNGLLDGKTKYNDPSTGKTVFSFKYKEGKLEE